MYFKTTYANEFDDLYMHLKAKYPQKLFDLDGIGKQMDMSEFSKNFFASKVTADSSIDSNANCDDVSVIAYTNELPKPFFRLNSYFILWKELRRLYGLEVANDIIEKQLIGDIYIHDFHGVAAGNPYSYCGKSVLVVKIKDSLVYSTMEDLYEILSKKYPEYIINETATQIDLVDVSVLDNNNTWVNVSRILKHKSHTNLVGIETKDGRCTLVTTDHPVILDSGEKYACDLSLSDSLKLSNSILPISKSTNIEISDDYAYFVGFLIGDGWINKTNGKQDEIRRANFSIRQNNIENTKIYKIVSNLFDNVRVSKNGTQIDFGKKADIEKILSIGIGSNNKKLPNDILMWGEKAIKNVIAGIIDSDGNINPNGSCCIRVTSFELIQQLGELFRTLNIGKTRTSFCGKYQSKKGFKSNYEIYRLTCRIYDLSLSEYSEKINLNKEIVYKDTKIDGRFEGNKIHKLFNWETPEYVYDITTESGHFHCQGLIQHNCFNFSTYDIMTKGLPMVKKIKSLPPKHLYAFKSQLEQFTTIASNSTLGATGLADLLVVMSYYVSNILKTKSDAHFKFASEEDCWIYIKENLVSFIYTINQPMRGNQCVKETTKVLTPDGFKTYKELKVGDLIYTWGKNGKLNIQPVKAINVYDFDGEMHQYQGRDIIQTVTPNHRVFHKKNNSDEYMLTNSFDLIDKKTPVTIPVAMIEDDRPDYPISDDMLKLIVFILTDGCIKKEDGKRDRVQFFKSKNRWGNDEFKSIMNNLDLKFSNHPKTTEFAEVLNCYCISTEDSQEIVKLLNGTKSEIPSWMYNLSKRQANVVIDTWALLDGHTEFDNYNKQKCQCDNYKIAEQLQHICFLAGRGSKISSRKIANNKKETIYLIPYHRINKDASEKSKVYYKGKVWCPTTDDGIVVFKEDDSIYVSGNSPFTNVSIYDDFFLNKLVDDYIFPDGSSPDKNIVKKLQELYLDIMNEELERTPLTFPVTTACFSIDKENNINDEEFLRMIAEKNKKFGFINIYCGDSSTLSSCCFDGKQKVLVKNSNGVYLEKIEDIIDGKYEEYRKNLTIFHNGSWVKAKPVKINKKHKMFKITTENNKTIFVTDNHINPTIDGDKETKYLTTNDYLMFNTRKLASYPEKDEHLTYEQGYLIGLYAGDGSKYKRKDKESYTVTFSLNESNIKDIPIIRKALTDWNINKNISSNLTNKLLTVAITSKELYDIISKYIYGNYSYEKEFNMNVLLQSYDFRKGICDGWYASDGGNSNRIYSVSNKLIETGEAIFTSIGINTIINEVDRTGKISISGKEFNRNYPTICIRWYDMKNKRSMENIYKVKNNCEYFKIKSIEEYNYFDDNVYCFEMENKDEPYFTLPNGIITHNCRLRSEQQSEYFNSFGSGE